MSLTMCHNVSCTMRCLPSSASTLRAQLCILLQVAAAVFAFRGTRLNKTGNLRADLHLLRDLNAEMVVTQRATKKIQNHIKRLQEQQGVKWSFYTTGKYCSSCVIVIWLGSILQPSTAKLLNIVQAAAFLASCDWVPLPNTLLLPLLTPQNLLTTTIQSNHIWMTAKQNLMSTFTACVASTSSHCLFCWAHASSNSGFETLTSMCVNLHQALKCKQTVLCVSNSSTSVRNPYLLCRPFPWWLHSSVLCNSEHSHTPLHHI